MSSSEFDCYESSDVKNISDNFNNSKINSESPKNISNLHGENVQIKSEVVNIEDYLEMKDPEHLTLTDVELSPDYLNENYSNEIKQSFPIILSQKTNDFKRNFLKTQIIKNKSINQEMSVKVKGLSKFFSVDNDDIQSNFESVNDNENNKTKNLFLDADFKNKMEELYHSTPDSENHYGSKSSLETNKVDRNNFNRSDSNWEIVEENFLPVSTTAKQLERQLSFASSPMSSDMLPRIPKLTRFARLNRFLSTSPEPE